ncbi:MAG: carbon storage regulator [Pirellulales bacterium]|nr:carbon storage regulator [Pirellulales bacterium]
MLVLSRRIGEEIVIDDTTRVVVLGIQGSRIRIGISAPPHVAIQRREVRDRETLTHSVAKVKCIDPNQEHRPALV